MTEAVRVGSLAEIDHSRICYWFEDGCWWIYLPECGAGRLVNHQVIKHGDKTISVSPSIQMRGHRDGKPSDYHGYLEHGKMETMLGRNMERKGFLSLLIGAVAFLLSPAKSLSRTAQIIFYGPHACERCGKIICKAARDQGGAEYDYPDGPIYPNTAWRWHACA